MPNLVSTGAETASSALAAEPAHALAVDQADLVRLALACVQSGDYPRAHAYALLLTQHAPDAVDSWKLLGVAQQHLGDLQGGLVSLEKSVALAPADANALCLYADGLLRLDRYTDAFQVYLKALQIEPDNISAGRHVADLLVMAHRPADAWNVLQQSIVHAPQLADLRIDAVKIALRMGALSDARLHASHALVLAPEQAPTRHVVGLVQLRMGDLPTALASFREELRLLLPSEGLPKVGEWSSPVPFDYRANEVTMWTAAAQMAQAGVHVFPTAGTLLGLLRDGHLLPFDKDVDMGLPYGEMDAARECLLANGWVDFEPHSGLLNPRSFRHEASGLLMDLCGYRTEAGSDSSVGGLWMEGVPDAWNRIVDFPPLSLRRITRPEGRVWTLAEPESWMQALYGDWRTPDPHFDSVIASVNQRGFALLTQCYALLRLANQLRDGKLRNARASTRVWLRHFPDDAQIQQIASRVESALADS